MRYKAIPSDASHHNKDFNLNLLPTEYFSGWEFFKTVHLGGDDVIKEREEAMKKEYEIWKSKLIVETPVFKVTKQSNPWEKAH